MEAGSAARRSHSRRKKLAAMRIAIGILVICSFQLSWLHSASAESAITPAMYSGMRWRLVGPFRGGRVLAVAGVTGNSNVFYFGAVGGGVWKTTDAGGEWKPIFDSQPVASIGAIAVAPSDPNIVYVGSGEADMRSNIAHGNGMYKSTDGGEHWKNIGLSDTRQIGRIVVDPRDPNRVYVAALGHAYAPNTERGVFRSDDGGATWKKILYKDADTGAIDLAMDPRNSATLYASFWQTRRPPWNTYPPSNGPGGGIYKSSDGGATWHQLANGLPPRVGHVGLSVSPVNSRRVYAIVDAVQGGLYRSDDAGASWKLLDGEKRIWGRGWYFSKITADPKDLDTLYVSNTSFYRSTNGGLDFTAIKGAPGGDDYQGVWIDPTQPLRMILASDQGAIVSTDGAKTWSSWYNQPTGQFYHVATDNRFPYWIYGAQQDSGAVGTPSRSNHRGISFRDWQPIAAGGESGYIAPDPDDPRILYGGTVDRFDLVTGQDRDITPELASPGIYRHTWTLPVVFSPHRPRALYYSTQVLFVSYDGGRSWQNISPDLSRPHPAVPSMLDATTVQDIVGGQRQGVIYTVAPSPLSNTTIWAGTDDGLIWLTLDSGKHWRNVTPPELAPWSKVGVLEASAHGARVAYAAVDRHRLDDDRPYIYRTRDHGRSWQLITSGIPNGSYVHVVREDPSQRGLLYAGTETGVFISFDDGERWLPLQLNLPTASVRDISIRQDDLVIATHGRAFWVLDNLTPLHQLATGRATNTDTLFALHRAFRVRPGDDQGTPLPLGTAQGENPPSGAFIDYYLSANQRSPVVIDIVDQHKTVVRRYSSDDKPVQVDPKTLDIPAAWIDVQAVPSAEPGMHRFVWDLHYAALDAKKGPGVLAPPAAYTVRLTANGRTYSKTLRLARDPRTSASESALRAQFDLARRVEILAKRSKDAYAEATVVANTVKEAWKVRALKAVIDGGPEDPLHSFRYVTESLDRLETQIESSDAAPTIAMQQAFVLQGALLSSTIANWNGLKKEVNR